RRCRSEEVRPVLQVRARPARGKTGGGTVAGRLQRAPLRAIARPRKVRCTTRTEGAGSREGQGRLRTPGFPASPCCPPPPQGAPPAPPSMKVTRYGPATGAEICTIPPPPPPPPPQAPLAEPLPPAPPRTEIVPLPVRLPEVASTKNEPPAPAPPGPPLVAERRLPPPPRCTRGNRQRWRRRKRRRRRNCFHCRSYCRSPRPLLHRRRPAHRRRPRRWR